VRSRLIWLAILLCASTASAQNASGGYRIAGRVIDAVTGDPVARAVVSVLTTEDYKVIASSLTDAEGHFSFSGLAAGKYPLNAARRGYRTSYFDEHEDFSSAIVTGDGQDTGSLLFRLPPAAVIRGVVTGDGGDPVESAQVMLFKRSAGAESGAHLQQVANIPTDDTGGYEFNNLPSGEYYIAVKADPWYAQHGGGVRKPAQEPSPLDVAYPTTYYDSTIDENAATPLTLDWGAREQSDINLHAVPAVRFTVPLVMGRRNSRPVISLHQKVFGNTVNVQSFNVGGPSQGTLDVPGMAPGTYDIEIGDPPRKITVNATSEVELDPSAGAPMLAIAGTLVMAGGGSVPDDISLVLTSDEGDPPVQADARQGHFQMNAVPSGSWTLVAGSQKQTLAVVATSVSGAIAAGNKIVVRDRPVQVIVTLSSAQTRVQGFAKKDGKGVSGAMIVLVPNERSAYPALVRRDQSDSDGSFSLIDVPAGQYTVVAIEDGWKLDWQRREVIEPYLRSGVAVTIAGQSAPVIELGRPVPVATPR
jgi:Carboxypeptidase regulatory-like domain